MEFVPRDNAVRTSSWTSPRAATASPSPAERYGRRGCAVRPLEPDDELELGAAAPELPDDDPFDGRGNAWAVAPSSPLAYPSPFTTRPCGRALPPTLEPL